MPPKEKVTKEEIINTAINIVREKGIENLNARNLARKMGCSVHPIFRGYHSMEGLKTEIYKMVEHIYNQQMLNAVEHGEDGFLNMGLAYINFAKDEKNLFKLLFMSDAFREQGIMDIAGTTEGDDEVLDMICQRTGLGKKSARELYTGIWLTTHGIASMIATNSCRFSDEENRRLLNNSFMGLLMKLKKEEEQSL
ncbi:TetR family transcriptional regulator [Mobilisporobacter senegalensis]|uniref:TetR family transcriptional regulator n=1 Tax=Mobilisporobacter senegalensis TaxID=1329262 RepID=A0A3N1XI51_9FIRM|nr:TetR-like C-terminal domain-containing protein [Mobilisporobacter senegalensis]ROR26345.1 TetR family transcriptional regulator [Mobilisporobacter senegalensis]